MRFTLDWFEGLPPCPSIRRAQTLWFRLVRGVEPLLVEMKWGPFWEVPCLRSVGSTDLASGKIVVFFNKSKV